MEASIQPLDVSKVQKNIISGFLSKLKSLLKSPRAWLRYWPHTSEYRRLAGDLQTHSIELDYLISRGPHTSQANSTWAKAARDLVAQAKANLEKGHLDEGWKCLDEAKRQELLGLDRKELITQEQSLRADMHKLSEGRRQAAEKLLAHFEKIEDIDDMRTRLRQATRLRDDNAQTKYYRIAFLRQQLTILNIILILALVAVLALSSTYPLNMLLVSGDWRNLVMVGLFGMLGASFSAILSVARTSVHSRIPEQVVNSTITTMRPVLGATSAIAAYVFLEAGIVNLQAITWGGILAIAFASGFSERLVIRAVESVSGQSTAASDRPDANKPDSGANDMASNLRTPNR